MNRYFRAQWGRIFGLNLSLVAPLLFVGGQFRAAQWPAIRALGVRAVLSLQGEREDSFEGPPPERALRLLVADFTPPSLEQIDEGVRFIAAAHAAELPVLVHCHAGVGRAPLLAAAYLISSEALTHRQALIRIKAARPNVGPNRAQVGRLREYEGRLRAPAPPAGETVR